MPAQARTLYDNQPADVLANRKSGPFSPPPWAGRGHGGGCWAALGELGRLATGVMKIEQPRQELPPFEIL